MPHITDKQYEEYQALRAKKWREDRKNAILEEAAHMDIDDFNDWMDAEAEYRMESGHRDYYQPC